MTNHRQSWRARAGRQLLRAAAVIVLPWLAACSTSYSSEGFTGGYDQKQLEYDIYRVTFSGNGYTTPETVQTYWLYRCVELTLQNGYQGFKIISNTPLSERSPEPAGGPRLKMTPAAYVPIYVPMDSAPKPSLSGDIQLLKEPIAPVPGKVFDAAALKAELAPVVMGKKCDLGNICPHVHRYLYPPGTIQAPAR